MAIRTGKWIKFEIEVNLVDSKPVVLHRLDCTTSLEGGQIEPCWSIEIASQVGQISKNVIVHNAATCAQDVLLGSDPYCGSSMTASIQQTATAEKEYFFVQHAPGESFKGSCRLAPLLSDLDAWRYLASNIDVAENLGASPESARQHFRDCGRYERRSFSFEPLLYLASHPDLEELGEDEIAACCHFVNYGAKEGREIWFQPKNYLDCNPDIRLSIGDNYHAASLHYLRYGRREGRSTQ